MNIKKTLKIIKDGGEVTFRPSWAAGDVIGIFVPLLLLVCALFVASFAIMVGEVIQGWAAFFVSMFSPETGVAIKAYPPASLFYTVFGGVFVLDFLSVLINRYSAEYRIDSTTIFASDGFIAPDTLSAPINQGIFPTTSQSLFGRIFNYGDISITVNTDSVATDTEVRFRDIDSPDDFVTLLEKVSKLKHQPRRKLKHQLRCKN